MVPIQKEFNIKKLPSNLHVVYIDEANEELVDKELTTTILQSLTTLPDLFISKSILNFNTGILQPDFR